MFTKSPAIATAKELTKYAQEKIGADFQVFPFGNEYDLVKLYTDGRKGSYGVCSKTAMLRLIDKFGAKNVG
jgi:hypothetical protein